MPSSLSADEAVHLLEEMPDGLVTVDASSAITVANRRASQILTTSREDLVGRDVREAIALETRHGESWWVMTDPWAGLATRTGHRERLLLLPDGQEVLVSARYLREHRAGPLTGIILGLRDVEARRRIEQDHAVLISTIAHELRSPLTGVKGFSSTLLRRWEQFSEKQRIVMLEAIDADADRLTRLITDLLDVSRIDTGRLRIHEVPLPTRERLMLHIQRAVASGRTAEMFTVSVNAGAEELYADPDRFDQVLANLVENALRHANSRVDLSAKAMSDSRGDGVVVSVRDDGPGVPPEQRRAVFGRFWHGPSGTGTGLGLYIVRGIVEAHGGWVGIDDAPDGGAVLQVFFPGEPT